MDEKTTLNRIRQFLLIMAAAVFIVTPIELIFSEHFDSLPQYIPFVLCALGLVAVALVWLRPVRSRLLGLRVIMAVIVFGSLFGGWEHLESNLEFAQEIKPAASMATVFIDALFGAAPLLAPGILAFGALLAIAATYNHVALRKTNEAVQKTSPSAQTA
ncbi:MAG: hypothetical protein J5I90_04815 [Caldilineales bacterium]|nr:hypothetical protein [Caldilineales bacterium]